MQSYFYPSSPPDTEKTAKLYAELEHLHSIYPYVLEILVFPFEVADTPIDDCLDDVLALEQQTRKIHIMQPVQFQGEPHPLYEYLEDLFKISAAEFFGMAADGKRVDTNGNTVTFNFFVDSDGKEIALDYGFDVLKDPMFWEGVGGSQMLKNRVPYK